MKITVTSDTHNEHDRLNIPYDTDLLIHCGDFTCGGTHREIRDFIYWINNAPGRYKLFIAGNHEKAMLYNPAKYLRLLEKNVFFLNNSMIELPNGIRVWGSSYIPRDTKHDDFCLPRSSEVLADNWSLVPKEADILVTHCPPEGVLDKNDKGVPVGCELLKKCVARVGPMLHVFGHIHEGFGMDERNGVIYGNASFIDGDLTGNEFLTFECEWV